MLLLSNHNFYTMKKITLLSLLSACWMTVHAAFTPLVLTGYNADIVSNGTVSASSSISSYMTDGFDSAGYALVAQDYNFAGYTPSYYLPTGGSLTSAITPGLGFQLADYSANNALRLDNNGDIGALSLATPQTAGALYICGLSGSGISTFDLTVNFSDGSSQVFSSLSFPDWYASGGSVVGIGRVSTTDNHTEGSSSAPSLFEIPLNLDPANYAKLITGISVEKTSATGILAIMAMSAEDICSGIPTAGTVAASVTTGCSAYTSNLSLPSSTASAGITYQWQSSPDNTTWTNVGGATNATYTAAVSATIYYRAYIICTTTGGGSDTSSSVELVLTSPSPIVATLPFSESFENWIGACYSFDRPGVNWLSSPPSGNNSWRRDDQGSDASWGAASTGGYSPVSTAGSHSARFHSYLASYGSLGDMDLYIDLSPTGTKQITFDYTNASGSDNLTVELSEDGGATFTSLGNYTTTSGWNTEVITTNSTAANAIIRFEAFGDDGADDIGLDNLSIITLTPCSGTPVAGTTSATQYTGCSAFISTVSLPISTVGGIVYQWQTSTDGAVWASIPGATDYTYTTYVTGPVYFRAYVVCTASSGSDTSSAAFLNVVIPTATVASLPFSESFENWIGGCYLHDRPGVNWLNNPSSGNDSWRRDDQGSDASWGAVGSGLYAPVSTNGSHSARFHSYLAFGEGDMDLYVDLSPAGTKQISFDYTNASGSDNLSVELSEDGGATFTTLGTYNLTPGWATNVLTTSSVAANAIIRFAAVGDDGLTDIGLDNISIVTLIGCSGTPVAGTISATQYTGCSAFTSTVSLPISSVGGLTYQWQSSADSSAWSDIPGATDFTYTTFVTANTYYRVYVTCTASSLTDTTAGVLLQIVTPSATTATVPFFESFENWIGTCYAADRPGINWLTNPSSGNDAWRRNDQGSDASWSFPGSYMYSPAATDGTYSARFHSGEASGGSTGSMDLYIDLSTPGTKLINFDYINTSGSDNLSVQLSEDGGATFFTLAILNTTSGWASELVTTTSVASNAVIRLMATADFGASDIGIDSFSVSIAPSCSGTPTAGTFTSSNTSGCTPYTSNLSVDAPLSLTGISYQWQSSTDGVSFSDVPGASTATYTASVSSNIYYRFYVACAVSGAGDTSAATELFYTPVVPIAATVPYFQGFENWIGGCYSFDRPDVSWSNTPTSGDNSWRRDDQGTDASWDYPTFYMYSPSSTEGSHSARFHSGYTHSGIEGDMNLYIDLSAAGTKVINFDYINLDGSDFMNVELSEDGGTTFTTIGTMGTTSVWVSESLTTTSVAANAVLRFAAVADYGGTDIGIDSLSITIAPSCSGTPVAGTFSSSTTSGCTAYTSNLSVTAPILLTGISYQWQSSTDGVTFTNVSGATSTNYTASVTANVYYRFYVSCAVSGDGDTSAATELLYAPVVPVYATLPYLQGFENWIAGCYSFDRPGVSWVNTPTTGNNSWRRDDQGGDASWSGPGGGSYSPVSTEGSHSARFHSYEADFGSVGTLDLYIDLSAPGTKQILFDYNNDNSDFGSDELDVMLSEDGGTTFTTLGTYPEVSGWVPEMLTTTSTAAHAIIRFSATSDFGNTDIGIDSVYVSVAPTPCDTPTALTVTGITTTSATISWTGVSGAAGYQYVVTTTSGIPTGSGTATSSTTVTDGSLTPSTTYYVYVRTECGGGDSSMWVADSFTTFPAPIPCNAAIGLTAASITDSSAVLSWTTVAGATGYQYVIDNSASAPTGSGTATTDTVYIDTSLVCNTTYYLHVHTDCSTDSSVWSTITFTTDTCSNVGVRNVQVNNFAVEAYPNPAKDVVNVEIKGNVSGTPAVQLTDVTGKVIQVITLSANKAQIDMSTVTPGIYFLNYSDNINRRTIKINKQ